MDRDGKRWIEMDRDELFTLLITLIKTYFDIESVMQL